MEINCRSDYHRDFPCKIELNGMIYVVDYISESDNLIKLCLSQNNKVLKHLVYPKQDGYINIKFLLGMIARNIESMVYWKAVKDAKYDKDTEKFEKKILKLFRFYWRKAKILW